MVFGAHYGTTSLDSRGRHRSHNANPAGSTRDVALDAGRSHHGVTPVSVAEVQPQAVNGASTILKYGSARCLLRKAPVLTIADDQISRAGSSERDCHRVRRSFKPLDVQKKLAIAGFALVGTTRAWYPVLARMPDRWSRRAASGVEPQKPRRFFR